jgi:hypothetical protein
MQRSTRFGQGQLSAWTSGCHPPADQQTAGYAPEQVGPVAHRAWEAPRGPGQQLAADDPASTQRPGRYGPATATQARCGTFDDGSLVQGKEGVDPTLCLSARMQQGTRAHKAVAPEVHSNTTTQSRPDNAGGMGRNCGTWQKKKRGRRGSGKLWKGKAQQAMAIAHARAPQQSCSKVAIKAEDL